MYALLTSCQIKGNFVIFVVLHWYFHTRDTLFSYISYPERTRRSLREGNSVSPVCSWSHTCCYLRSYDRQAPRVHPSVHWASHVRSVKCKAHRMSGCPVFILRLYPWIRTSGLGVACVLTVRFCGTAQVSGFFFPCLRCIRSSSSTAVLRAGHLLFNKAQNVWSKNYGKILLSNTILWPTIWNVASDPVVTALTPVAVWRYLFVKCCWNEIWCDWWFCVLLLSPAKQNVLNMTNISRRFCFRTAVDTPVCSMKVK